MNTEALFALAFYLTTRAGERLSREEVLEVFWPEGADESRRHAMRQMMYRLRQKGFELNEEGEFLRLDPARVDSDLRQCLEADWVERASAPEVEAALALGPTFSTRLAAPFLDWFDGVRSAVAAQHRKAAQKQITQARREGRWEDVEQWSQAVLRTDPLNEEATLARAESAAMAGSKVQALEILDTYLAEIGEVAPELGKPAVVLRKRIAERRADWSHKGPREVRLVGRSDIMRKLNSFADSVSSGESVHLLLEGPPGSGKSRLLSEAAGYAELRGLRVLSIRAEKVMQEHPLALARTFAAQLVGIPGAAGVAPDHMNVAATLAEEAAQFRNAPSHFSHQLSASSIATSLTGVIASIGYEQRLVVVLDDLQWADQLSLLIVGEILRATRHSRVGIMAGTRPSVQESHMSTAWNSFDQRHRVPSLSDEAASLLATETAASHSRTLDRVALKAIIRTAGGNPLFVRELTIIRHTFAGQSALPDSLSQIVEDRIGTLDPREQRLLRITALLGDVATLARVRAASALSHAELQHSLERLESEAMIRMSVERMLDVHDCWSEVLLQQTSSTALAALALECAEQLIADSGVRSHAIQRRTGHLLRIAGENYRALEYFLASSDSLHAVGLPREAMESMGSYSALADHPAAQARLRYRHARSLATLGDPAAAALIIEELRRSGWLRQQGLWHEHLAAILVLAETYIRIESADQAPIDELLTLAHHPSLGAHDQQNACLVGVRIASNLADSRLLVDFALRSRAIDESGSASYAGWMTALVHATECESALDIQEIVARSSTIDRFALTIPQRCLMHRFACHALRVAGLFSQSVEQGQVAHDLAIEHSLYHQARVASELLAHVCLDYEDLPGARLWIAESAKLSHLAAISTTTRSHEHAEDRLGIQEGNFEAVAPRILSRLPSSRSARTASARLGELAIAALCIAHVGPKSEAETIAAEAAEEVTRFIGQHSIHFAAELTARALHALGHSHRATALLQSHLRARIPTHPPRLPPFYTHLAAADERLSL
jgi:DNA-binding SARP family transcriptional activator